MLRVIAFMVCHPRFSQASLLGDVAINAPLRAFMPTYVKSGQLGEETQITVWQIVMDIPREGLPLCLPRFVAVSKPRQYYAGGGTHAAVTVQLVPYVGGVVGFVTRAI